MTAADDFLEQATQQQRPEPKRNQWGQYAIPHPETGEEVGWVRATTWAKTVDDTFALTQWDRRCDALGLAARPDLLLQVKAIRDPEDPDAKKALNRICDEAKEASGAAVRANIGTALHAFAEQQDAGLKADPGPEYRKDLDAYHAALTRHGITLKPEWMERVVIVPELQVAGTLDRLVEWDQRPGALTVGDLKTGRSMERSWATAIIQQCLYTRATHWVEYDKKGNAVALHPMPKVTQDRALIFHLPAGEGYCNVYELIDMEAAWHMASVVVPTVRTWRKRKDLAVLVTLPEDDPFADAANAADGATDVVAGAEAPGKGNPPGPGEGEAASPAATQDTDSWDPFGQVPADGNHGDGAAPPAVESPAADEQPAPTDVTKEGGARPGGLPSDEEPFLTNHDQELLAADAKAKADEQTARDLAFDVPSADTTGGDADGLTDDDAEAGAPAPADRILWLRQRLRAMRGNDKAMGACARLWPHDIPTKPPWTSGQLDALVTVVEQAEAHGVMPFPEERDPAKPAPERRSHATNDAGPAPRSGAPAEHDTKDGRKVSKERRTELQGMARSLGDQQVHVMRWLGEAAKAGVSFDIAGDDLRDRVWKVARAAVLCARDLLPSEDTEPLTRAVLSFCWPTVNHPEPWDSSWSTGAAFGRLTSEAATIVADTVAAFAQGDATAVAQVGQHAVQDP